MTLYSVSLISKMKSGMFQAIFKFKTVTLIFIKNDILVFLPPPLVGGKVL